MSFTKTMDSSPNILEYLNDDCLYEIMKQKCIDINDLMEMAATCERLEYIAQQVFCNKFRNKDHFEEMKLWTLDRLAMFLRLFGQFCRTIAIDWEQMKSFTDINRVLHLITKYCKSLVSLKLFREDATEYLSFVSSTRSRTELKTVEMPKVVDFSRLKFYPDLPLEVLKLHNCQVEIPEQHFSQLKVVVLCRVWLRQENVDQFFKLNPQIVRMKYAPDVLNLQSLGDAIKHLVNLEVLTYLTGKAACGYFHSDTDNTCFEQLKKLRWLRIETSDRDTCNILNALHRISAPLGSLNVVLFHRTIEVSVNMLINTICQFKLLKELMIMHFRSGMANDFQGQHLIQLIDNLPLLEHISCSSSNINFRDISDMLEQPNQLQSAFFKIAPRGPLTDLPTIESIATRAKNRKIRTEIVILYKVGKFIFESLTRKKKAFLRAFHSNS